MLCHVCHERWQNIRKLTNLALAAAKGTAASHAKAEERAATVQPIITTMHAKGASLRRIAAELNARGIPAARREMGPDAGLQYSAA